MKKYKFLAVLYLIAIISCSSPFKSYRYTLGIRPDNKETVYIKNITYIKNWWLWEGHTPKKISNKLIVQGKHWDKNITTKFINVLKENNMYEKGNEFNNVFNAYPISDGSWVFDRGNLIFYRNGTLSMTKDRFSNIKFVSDDHFLHATFEKSIDDETFVVGKAYLYNLKNGENFLVDQIVEGFKEIPEIMGNPNDWRLKKFFDDSFYTYDTSQRRAYFLVSFDVEDFYNYTYLVYKENNKYKVIDVFLGKGMGFATLMCFKSGLYVEIVNHNNSSHRHDNQIARIDINDGSLTYLKVKARYFIYYKNSLYGSDFQNENIIKISD